MTALRRASESRPSQTGLPRTFRPRLGRYLPWALGLVLFLAALTLAVLLPASWSAADRTLMVLTGLAMGEFLRRVGSVRVRADEDGLLVVNILSRERLAWAQVVSLRLREGDPWLVLDLDDGTTLSAMGVQGSEGAWAREQAVELATLVARRSALG